MIFLIKENKVKDFCIEEQNFKHGSKKIRLDDSAFFTVLRIIAFIKATLVIFHICLMGYIICKTTVFVSHVSFYPLVMAHYIS